MVKGSSLCDKSRSGPDMQIRTCACHVLKKGIFPTRIQEKCLDMFETKEQKIEKVHK